MENRNIPVASKAKSQYDYIKTIIKSGKKAVYEF